MVPPQPLGGAADKHNHKRKDMDDFDLILQNGINFGRGGERPKDDGKVKTKAKKKTYITGLHGSGAAKMKAEIRRKRANRPSQRKRS